MMSSKNYPLQKHKDEISLEEAVDITTNWRNFIAPFNKECTNCEEGFPAFVDGFTIPLDDLIQLKQEKGFSTVRVYLGKDYNTETGKYGKSRLVLVGVEEDDNLTMGPGKDIIGTEPDNSEVYDFTTACPPYCDKESPLKQS
ncbi:hypothetical protein [Anseongella ginsenosidimutans]|nr:hypothetical protein [Anseongella ginsenosidimutans]QEC53328.1 hypothetical protein FRZ59_13935 [Anseongella ginsenosidimutans]